ncbi:MAG: filamentous hemagglutinin N-terminal domain-containing protein [Candidatus Omnitrophota bacterium]
MKIIKAPIACFIILSLFLGLPFNSFALPEGAQVVSGSASFVQPDTNTLNVTTSNKAIIEYNSFNIAQPESVNFIQPSSQSVVLNRVVGINPSEILGRLSANGQVFLVNPNGIFFGPNSRIDCGSFMASTLDISNDDFLSGNYQFNLKDGYNPSYIINRGTITVDPNGYCILASPLVANEGTIVANLGQVVIAGTNQTTISFDQRGIISFAIPELNQNASDIVIPQNYVSDLICQVVNYDALVEAGHIIEENGQIRLVAAEGLALNSGEIHADGAPNQDAGLITFNSQQATALVNSLITANGLGENSNAGTIKILSSMQGGFSAAVSDVKVEVRSIFSGNGGLIEFSANTIYIEGLLTNATAQNGAGGILLLDPFNIEITVAAGTLDGLAPNFTANADNSTIGEAAIEAQLNAGTSVIISTADGGTQEGDITVTAAIDKSAGGAATITMNAADDIVINNTITSTTGALNVALNANGAFGTASGDGAVDINATITTLGGTFTSTGVAFDNTGGIIDTDDGLGNVGTITITHTGAVTIGADLGDFNGAGAVSITCGGANTINLGANITTNTAAIDFNNAVVLTASSQLSTGSTGGAAVTFDSTVDGTAGTENLTITTLGGGSVTFSGALGATTAINNLNISAMDMGVAGAVTYTFANIGTAIALGANSVTVSTMRMAETHAINFTGTIYNAGTGVGVQTWGLPDTTSTINVNAGAATTFQTTNVAITFSGGILTLADKSDITINSGTAATTIGQVSAGANDITITADSLTLNSNWSATGGGAVVLQPSTAARTIGIGDDATGNFALSEAAIGFINNSGKFNSITIGRTDGTGAIDIQDSDATITFADPVVIRASNSAITLDTAFSTAASSSSIEIDAGAGSFTSVAAGTIASGSGGVTLTCDTIALDGTITSTGNVILQPSTVGRSIGIAGGAGDFSLTAAEIAEIQDGAASITIGRSNGSGGATINAITFNDPITINSPSGGTITVNGQITGSGDASVTLDGSGATTVLNADIVTAGQAITISDNVQLDTNVTLDTTNGGTSTGATINITGTVDSVLAETNSLTLDSTSGGGSGNVTITGAIGATTALSALTITAKSISLGSIGTAIAEGITGATSVTATTSIAFTGATYTANQQTYDAGAAGNAITMDAGAATTFTSSGDDITFTGTITLANGSDLTITPGLLGGNITVGTVRGTSSEDFTITNMLGNSTVGAIGNADEINTVNVSAGATLTLNGGITTSDAAGNTVTLNSTANITLGADVTIDTDTAGNDGDITLTGAIDGGKAFALTAGLADVTVNSAIGATTAVTSLTISGNDIVVNSIGGAGAGVTGDTTITGSDAGGDVASIRLDGTTYNANKQTYNAGAANSITLNGFLTTTFTSSNDTIGFTGLVDGGVDLVLAAGTGNTTFNNAVGSATPIGDGTGAALTINSTGTTSFESTLATASGITSANGAGDITFKGDVTIAAGNTATTLNNAVVNLDGLTFQSGGDITFGNAGTDQVNLTTAAVTINTTGAGDDLIVNSLIDGAFDLTLGVTGTSTFNAAVGSVTPIGDGIGAALIINSTSTTSFESTLVTASGITQANGAGAVTFKDDITIAAGDTASTFNANITLDGLTLTSAGALTFGNAATDTLTLSTAAVTITTAAAGTNQTYSSLVDGLVGLTITCGANGSLTFNAGANVGATNPPTSITTTSNNATFRNATSTGPFTINYYGGLSHGTLIGNPLTINKLGGGNETITSPLSGDRISLTSPGSILNGLAPGVTAITSPTISLTALGGSVGDSLNPITIVTNADTTVEAVTISAGGKDAISGVISANLTADGPNPFVKFKFENVTQDSGLFIVNNTIVGGGDYIYSAYRQADAQLNPFVANTVPSFMGAKNQLVMPESILEEKTLPFSFK